MQKNLKKETSSYEELGELHPKEVALILWIRNKWRFGKLEIKIHNGLPVQVIRRVETHNLGMD